MTPIGKCPPEVEELESIGETFDKIELYLNRKHLDNLDQSISNCRDSKVSVEVVHTPHVPPHDAEYFELTNDLAESLDSKIVLHSGNILTYNWDSLLDDIDLKQPWGIENSPGDSPEYFYNNAIEPYGSITLDVAHLFMATGPSKFFDEYEWILENNGDDIEILHLADSTIYKDGLSFGEGDINMEKTIQLAEEYYDGLATVEVMQEDQPEDLKFLRDCIERM